MNFSKTIITAAALTLAGAAGASTLTAEEIKQISINGPILPWGALKAGNKDGTIPEYTGGVHAMAKKPKYDWKSGIQYDPYPEDKVLFWIDAKNLDKYADKVSPGVQAMIRKSPETMRLAVYPTRRSVSYPKWNMDNSVKNATRCGLERGGDALDLSKGCVGGFPFPIPKNGYEVMWDHNMAYLGNRLADSWSHMVKGTGEKILVNHIYAYEHNPFVTTDHNAKPAYYKVSRTEYYGPTRIVGNTSTNYDGLDGRRTTWSYQTASRRTRLAPDQKGDMPIATTGGSMLYDQISLFAGPLEEFDWKLVGKKEMYIPYNNYRLADNPLPECTLEGGVMQAYHPNPNCIRWELHRVWHVKGILKPEFRHVLGTRDYYFDEDTYLAGLGDGYDKGGKLYIVQWTLFRSDYMLDVPMASADHLNFDLNSGVYHYPFRPKAWVLDQPVLPSGSNAARFILKLPTEQ